MVIGRNGTARKRVISPSFPIPAGTDIFEYKEIVEDVEDDVDDDDVDDESTVVETKEKKKRKKPAKKKAKKKRAKPMKKKAKKRKDTKDDSKRPNSPKSLEIVKQTIRTKADGSQVVDLTIDVDKIGRADKYEFRVVKKDNGNVKVITG